MSSDDELYADGLRDLVRSHAIRPGEFPDTAGLLRDTSKGGWLELVRLGFSGSDDVSLESALLSCEVFGREAAPFTVVTTAGFIQPLLSAIGVETAFAGHVGSWIESGRIVAVPVARPGTAAEDWRFGLSGNVTSDVADGVTKVSGRIDRLTDAAAEFILVTFDCGSGIAAIPIDSDGVTVTTKPSIVPGLEVSSVDLDAVKVDAALIHSANVADCVNNAVGTWSVVLDAYAVGVERELVERTVSYVSTRRQFGQAIGAFQGVQHIAADMHVAAETSFGIMSEAATRWVDGASDAVDHIAASRLHCAASAISCCESAIQLHGGAGFTWELGLHYWYRAAQFLLGYLSDELALRELLVARISQELVGTAPPVEDLEP